MKCKVCGHEQSSSLFCKGCNSMGSLRNDQDTDPNFPLTPYRIHRILSSKSKPEMIVKVDGSPITPTEVEGRSVDEFNGRPLVALFGRWYDASRLEIK